MLKKKAVSKLKTTAERTKRIAARFSKAATAGFSASYQTWSGSRDEDEAIVFICAEKRCDDETIIVVPDEKPTNELRRRK